MKKHIFKFTYQDRALNMRRVETEADSWMEAIIFAVSRTPVGEKLIYIECIDKKE